MSNSSTTTTTPSPISTTTLDPLDAIQNTVMLIEQKILYKWTWIIAITLYVNLLVVYKFRPNKLYVRKGDLSAMVLVFMGVQLFNCCFNLFNNIYVDLIWLPITVAAPNYAKQRDFFGWLLGIGFVEWLSSAPVAVFFLVLDRYLALRLNIKYTPGVRKLLVAVELLVLLAVTVFSCYFVIIDWTGPNGFSLWDCYICDPLYMQISITVYNLWRPFFAVLNLSTSFLFLYQLKTDSAAKLGNVKTRVVNYTIVLELVFNAVPSFATYMCVLAELPIYTYLEAHQAMLTSIDSMICAIFYTRIMFIDFRFGKVMGMFVGLALGVALGLGLVFGFKLSMSVGMALGVVCGIGAGLCLVFLNLSIGIQREQQQKVNGITRTLFNNLSVTPVTIQAGSIIK